MFKGVFFLVVAFIFSAVALGLSFYTLVVTTDKALECKESQVVTVVAEPTKSPEVVVVDASPSAVQKVVRKVVTNSPTVSPTVVK